MRLRHYEDLHRFDANGRLMDSYGSHTFSKFGKTSPVSVDLTTLDGPTGTPQIVGSLDGTEPSDFGDVRAITLTAGVTYSFAYRPTATGGMEDPYLLLANSGGTILAQDDDGGAGRSSLLTFTPTTTGTYLLAAASWVNLFTDDSDTGGYTIDIWTPQTSPDTPATMAGAATIVENTTTFGHATSGTDVDMYQIDLTAGRFYTFNFSGGVVGNAEFGEAGSVVATIELLDSSGNVLASNLNFESGMTWLNETTGTYYVRVTPFAGTNGGYTLDASSVVLADEDPLEAFNWDSADNIRLFDTNGDGVGDTAYVYFAEAGENFGEIQGDGGPDGDETTDDPLVSLGWNEFEKQQVMLMLNQEYGKILGINYVETDNPLETTFRLITTEDEEYGARFYPHDVDEYGTQIGIGTFNKDSHGWTIDLNGKAPGSQQSLEQGGWAWELLLHEFGHAHGIAHPHDNGGGSEIMVGVTAAQGSLGVYNLNQSVYSVMSYNGTWQTSPDGPTPFALSSLDSGSVGTLSPFDIAVLELRYGPLPERNTGDNVYTLTDVQDDAFYQTIWDHGGEDEIAYNGRLNAQIDLTAATLDYTPTGGGVVSFLYNTPGLPNSQIVRGGFLIAGGVEIENATGGSGHDILLGNDLVNVLTGNDGDDTLMGRLGDDTLDGGDGADVAAYNDATGAVTVDIGANIATGPDGTDTLIDVEGAIGSRFNDTLTGDDRDNVFDGGDGDDTITGGAGSDTLSFGTATAAVNVTLAASGSGSVTTVAGTDTYTDMENLTGSRFNDRLTGNGGDNALRGGDGVDVLTGALGNDTFVAEYTSMKATLKSGPMSLDIITDFDQAGDDKIDVSNMGIDFNFRGTANSSRVGDLTYKTYTSLNGAENALGFDIDGVEGAGGISGPVTVVYGNVNGGGADFAIVLLNQSSVSSDDFLF